MEEELTEIIPVTKKPFNWNEALFEIRFKLADWLLYNHHDLMNLVLQEEFGGGVGDGIPDSSLESQVERFITSSQYRLYILNITGHYIDTLEPDKFELYRWKYEERLTQREIAKRLRVVNSVITERIQRIKNGLLDEWEESGILLDNVYRFRQKYDWVGENQLKVAK